MNTKDINKVKLFLMDMDGTVYLGDNKIEGAFETLEKLRQKDKKVCFFTNNSSKSYSAYINKLAKLGFVISEDEIMTSGQVTAEYLLREYPNKKVFVLGTEALSEEMESMGVELCYKNPDVIVIGFDTSLCYDRLYQACRFIMKGLPYLATHPDMVCPSSEGDMPDVGSFILLIDGATGRKPDVVCGKPYEIAAVSVKNRFNLDSSEIAMVGDRLYTDIRFGIDNDFYSTLVLTGETNLKMLEESGLKPDLVLRNLSDIMKFIK